MRKFLLLQIFVFSCIVAAKAQGDINFNKVAALQLVDANKSFIGLSDEELNNTIVSSSYNVSSTGMTMVYLQQTFKSVPVLNKMKVLAFKDGKLVSNAGILLNDLNKLSGGKPGLPSVSPEQAVRLAFAEEKLAMPAISPVRTTDNGLTIEYGKPAGVTEDVIAKLMWVPVETNDQVSTMQLCWQVQVAPARSDDIWHIRIDAFTGRIIQKENIVIYENLEAPDRPERVIEPGRQQHINRNWVPEFGTTVNNGFNRPESPSVVANATYNVIPYPLEAPSFGSEATRTNPWTAAPGNASTLGWHSDGTNDFAISRGNNVWASEDTLGTDLNTTGISAQSTTPSPNLTFNFTPNYGVEPSMNSTMQKFCITNLFYWVNITHDITYQYGFDEVSGNFQSNNQGRGGTGNDFVKALAQSGLQPNGTHAHIGNNANFATGPDGGTARMRMYLFSNSSNLHANSPEPVAGDYACVESGFSQNNKLAAVGPVTGDVVYYDDGGGTHEACNGPSAVSVSGKIAMIDRGTCNFTQKVLNAQAAGAIAVIMVDNVSGNLVIMAGDEPSITIPAVFISQANGLILKAALTSGLNVTLSGTAVKDGDLDAGIMVHEYSHGISNRLTGGPATSSCLNNAEQGGEGWSDYIALMLTTNWATATTSQGAAPRPVGTYVIHETPNGEGIRNYPYSTNIAVNPLTYAHMGLGAVAPWIFSDGNEVHNIGEIWCVALWEMTWAIIQQENSINTNLYNYSSSSTGGNTIALKLVIEGMRLQNCNPGFIDARNAILLADRNLYGGRHQCAIWTAFAKRGMGYGASQGTATSTSNQTAAFDLPPAPTITTQPASVTVNPGDNASFTVAVTAPVNGAGMVYKWQVSTDGGTNWADVSPAVTTPTLTLTAVTVAMNGNKYRCVISQGCASSTSNVATLTVNVPGGFTFSDPAPATATCPAPNTMDIVLGTTVVGTFSNPITVSAGATPPGTTVSFIPSNTVTPGNSVTVRLTGTASLAAGSYVITITGTATGSANQTKNITYTINPGAGPTITAQPGNQAVCVGANASFSITSAAATGFQWQLSTDGGANWANVSNGGVYSGATTATLNLTGVTIGLNGNRYRVIASSVCGTTTSNPAILTVNSAPAITGQPANASICAGANHTFTVTATGSTLTYQWYISTDNGANFTLLANGGVYSGATTASLTITNATVGLNNNQYRVEVSGVCPVSPLTSTAAVLTVGTPVSITTQPSDVTICAPANTSFSVVAAGAISYQWQLSIDGGANWTNITNGGVYSNATTATLNLTGATATLSGNKYRAVITSGCGSINSNAATLTANAAPAITGQPSSASVCTGGNASFSATVTGSSLSYLWYVSTDGGGTFNPLSNGGVYGGVTTATLTITGATIALNGNQYHLVVTGICPANPTTVTSNNVTLTVATSLSITTHPSDATLCAGGNTSFSVVAVGAGSYQWQLSTDGGANWANITNGGVYSNATTATLNLTGVTTALSGNRYRVAITSGCGNANSNSALLTVNALPAITTQPTDVTLCAGANTTFTAAATGSGLSHQWQLSTNGCSGPWNNITGATSSSFTLNGITAGQNNTGYRVVVSGTCTPDAISNCALLTVVTAVTVTTQPVDQTVCEGANASYTVAGAGSGILYQWQVSTDGGVNWTNVTNGGVYSNATTATLNITGATFALNGNRYRAQLSNATCTTPGVSNAALLTVNRLPAISTQPVAAAVCVAANASFSVTATGTGLTYQWQVSTTGCAGTFANIANGGVYSGALTSTLTITGAPATMNGYAYKVVVSGTCAPAVTSSCVVLSVGSTVTITTQPANQSVCAGAAASFTVEGSGTNILYQWQASNDGINWVNIPAATNPTYSIPVTIPGMNNTRYRAQVSNAACNTPNPSNAALLTVNSAPSISFAPTATICLTDPALTLTATPAGGTFSGTGVTGSVFTPSVAGLGVKTITYSATSNGCTSTAARTIQVNECSERHLRLGDYTAAYVYPIPNQGDFSIRLNTDLYSKLNIRIYNNLGQMIKSEQVSGVGYGSVIPVHVNNVTAGTYQVYLVGEANGQVSTKAVSVIIGRP